MSYELKFLLALLITVAIETAVLFLILKYFFEKPKLGLILFLGFICSFSTLPYLWFVLPVFIKTRYQFVIVAESFAVIIEALVYYVVLKVRFKNAFVISLICNMASFLAGLFISF